MTIYPLVNPSKTFVCHSTYGPIFGEPQNLSIGQLSNLNTAGSSKCELAGNFNIPQDKDGMSPLTGQKDSFTCEEVEIF